MKRDTKMGSLSLAEIKDAKQKIDMGAGLIDWNTNVLHEIRLSEDCIRRKRRAVDILRSNNDRLCVYVGNYNRERHVVIVARSIYKQNKEYIDQLIKQIDRINSLISQVLF